MTSGEMAALLTSLCFATSSTLYTFATRRFGALVVNRVRLVLAAAILLVVHTVLYGSPLPLEADGSRWFWLGISGVVGLMMGDIFLLNAYATLGARLSSLMMSLAPAIAALGAWLLLGERPAPLDLLGISITLAGIAWVVLERAPNGSVHPQLRRGLLYGLGAAAGQGLGLVLSKQGLGGNFPAISGNVMRMLAAMVAMWLLTFFQGQGKATLDELARKPRDWWYIAGGVLAGPVVGVSLSLYAVQHGEVGVASTLMALPPVILLPVGYFVFKERFGWGAVAGTLVAMLGVAILTLV